MLKSLILYVSTKEARYLTSKNPFTSHLLIFSEYNVIGIKIRFVAVRQGDTLRLLRAEASKGKYQEVKKSKPEIETKGTSNFLGPICPVYSRQIYNNGTARVKLHNLKTIRKQ